MKNNLLKRIMTLGLSFCMLMSLAGSAFAFRNGKASRMLNDREVPDIIEYRFKDYNAIYYVGGLNRSELVESDFTYESLGETKVNKLSNGSIEVFNPCCSIKVMFAVAALYALEYDETEILDFIVALRDSFSSKNISEIIMDEVLKNIEHKNIDIAMDMVLFFKKIGSFYEK